MNKKTFTLAFLFFCVTLAWLGANIYWAWYRKNSVIDLVIALLFVAASAGMVYNECKKKKCKHIEDVNKHQIP